MITTSFPGYSFGVCREQESPFENEIPYMAKENDKFVEETDLKDGIHPVFFNASAGRGIKNQYTHSAISICLFMQFSQQNEDKINFLISEKAVGCLFIKNRKIISLTIHESSFERLYKGNLQEILLRIGSDLKAINHPLPVRAYKSEEEYKNYVAKIIPSMRRHNLLSS